MAQQPQTLEQLYVEARRDLERGGPDVVLKWAGKHARAAGRAAEVERRVRQRESDWSYWRTRADYQAPGESAPSAKAMETLVGSVRADDMELGDAVAAATFCAHVLELARAQPAKAAQPNLRAVPGGKP